MFTIALRTLPVPTAGGASLVLRKTIESPAIGFQVDEPFFFGAGLLILIYEGMASGAPATGTFVLS